ncbi:MAG: SGNH/GDSL hydrolase family protein [Hyphomicrobiaceae bacterium]
MRANLGQLARNCLLSLVSLGLCLMVLEFVVFRFILVPDDLLQNVSINGVVRYQPSTHATFRHPDGSSSHVTINADGWNSTRPGYAVARVPGVRRIAVVGDSYVHAAFVDTADAFPEVLERTLVAGGVPTEVYRFGMDGAPLSQYLHVLRREVLKYKPDLVVVPLIHNDFDESWRFLKTRYASSFLKIGRTTDGRPLEIPPTDFHAGTADLLRRSAAFRYLYYETNAYLHFKSLISRHFWGGTEDWNTEFISSAVDIRKIADHEKNRFAARYVMAEMKRLAAEHGFRLLFVMDGVREAVYAGKPRADYAVARLNELAAGLTDELGLPFLDLQQTFAADYARHHQRFEFSFDWHWNRHANRLVAEAIAQRITNDPVLLTPLLERSAAVAP